MSREEAISLIKSAQLMLINPTTNEPVSDLYEALEMAIKALSQESCDDAISREWLMRKATERFYTTNYFNHISAMIEEAPSVTQKSVLDEITAEIYEHFMTIDGNVHDKSAIKCMEIIGKYK